MKYLILALVLLGSALTLGDSEDSPKAGQQEQCCTNPVCPPVCF